MLIICVFGCVTVPKYAAEIRKISSTWASNLDSSVKVLFFLGEEKVNEFFGDRYIYLPGVKNDYMSASYKQFLGLKYIREHYNPDFVHCCGTDTFVNIPKMMQFLAKFDSSQPLYIGGHGDSRTLLGHPCYFHSGGPGFILSRASVHRLYPFYTRLTDKWINVCMQSSAHSLIPACDVAIAFFLQRYVSDVLVVKTNDLSFIYCNHRGSPCHPNQIDMRTIISCHSMSLADCDDFYAILLQNRFFV